VSALRSLLSRIVDYAGLFPPAGLDMPTAVRNYAAYRLGDDAWMLGRFVVPTARLDEFQNAHSSVGDTSPNAWRLAALLGADAEADVARVRAFNRSHGSGRAPAIVDSLEAKLAPSGIGDAASLAGDDFSVFVEIPVDDDPEPHVAAIARSGLYAKIRTGGVTADAFPPPRALLRAMRCCVDARVAFKATAGLHHPLRAERALTYAPDAPRGTMFGFLNVFLSAALLRQGSGDDEAREMLDERDPRAFEPRGDSVSWRGRVLTIAQLATMREETAVSFGSCSFREPVDDLHALGWLPA
jgi:hypothetical protein